MSFSIEGDKEVQAKLDQLEPKLAKKIMRKALREGQKVISKEAKANAPKDTGALRKSISVRAGKRSVSKMTFYTIISEGTNKAKRWYGNVIEWGSKKRGIEAQHYMRQAFNTKAEEAKQTTIKEVLKALDETVKGA